MKHRSRWLPWIASAVVAPVLLSVVPVVAQGRPVPPKAPYAGAMPAQGDKEVADTQEQLLTLLRTSPVLTSVVARDPSLLADQAYVNRNNPELAQFLLTHPDVARNPEFYLFSHLTMEGGRRDQALERAVWPDLVPPRHSDPPIGLVMHDLVPMVVVFCIFGALVLIFRAILENRRWNRTYKQQGEVHARLIDKLTTGQDLAAYMETDAGKQFLTAASFAEGAGAGPRMPNVVARVLTPLQVGVVLALLGIGLLLVRHAGPDMDTPMLVLGTLALMPGIGFILSAGATWVVARRLGLMPEAAENESAVSSVSQNKL